MHSSPPPPPPGDLGCCPFYGGGFAVVDLLLLYLPLFVGVLCLSLFCYALLCVHSSFAIILKRKRKLVALRLLFYRCIVVVNDLWLFLTGLWVGLQCVIVVFPDHTHLLLEEMCIKNTTPFSQFNLRLSTITRSSAFSLNGISAFVPTHFSDYTRSV